MLIYCVKMLSVAFYSSSEDEETTSVQELNEIKKQLRQQANIFALPNKKFVKKIHYYCWTYINTYFVLGL